MAKHSLIAYIRALTFIATALFCALTFVSFDTAQAAGGEKKDKKDAAQSSQVEIPAIVIPVARGQRLVNYAFLTIIVQASNPSGADIVRSNTFLVKDAVVRGSSRAPIVLGLDDSIDKNALAIWLKSTIQGALNGVVITKVEIKSLDLMR